MFNRTFGLNWRPTLWSVCALVAARCPIGVSRLAAQENAPAEPATATTATAPSSAADIKTLFEDFLHYARMGKFEEAEAFAQKLLQTKDLNPVELLAIAEADRKSFDTLLVVIKHSPIGSSASKVLDLIHEGEYELRRDVSRIKGNVEKLGGPPQMEYLATRHLAESGEYAVPWMLHALGDPGQQRLHARVLAAFPKLGRAALNPLIAGLETNDEPVREQIVRLLGQLGYRQALPYLHALLLQPNLNAATKAAAREAIEQIAPGQESESGRNAAEEFVLLADQFYQEHGSVAADPTHPTANIWYYDAQTAFVKPVSVPQRIFGMVMAMRASERALLIQPEMDSAIALWLAANIRREARLGLNVEDGEPATPEEPDHTRPEDYPRSLYFTMAAGPHHAQMVLARAIQVRDSAVALGAIAALRRVAGEGALVGNEDGRPATGVLAMALEFPDRVVRTRAALALANTLPRSRFHGAESVVPVLAAALPQSSQERFVVVDPSDAQVTRLVGEMRGDRTEIIGDTGFYRALDRARAELGGVTGFVLSSSMREPSLEVAVQHLRREFAFSRVPIVVLTKPEEEGLTEAAAKLGPNVVKAPAVATGDELLDRMQQVRSRTGETPWSEALSEELALESAVALRRVGLAGATILDPAGAQAGLIAALKEENEALRIACASALAVIGAPAAQQAIADVALGENENRSLRLEAFAALAESARLSGNLLDEARLHGLIEIAQKESDLGLRSAAAQALGALNLRDNKASEIIRSYHRG